MASVPVAGQSGPVVIDAGHGGQRPAGRSTSTGVRGPGGTLEKDVTLDLARRVAGHLGGAVLTREGDINLALAERSAVARRYGAPVFVSLHANAGAPGSRGTEVYVHSRAGGASHALAQTIQQELATYGSPSLGMNAGEMAVLTPERLDPRTAACLVEVDYLSDADGERRLRDPRTLDTMSQAIARGIRRYMGQPNLAFAQGQPSLAYAQNAAGIAAAAGVIQAGAALFQAVATPVNTSGGLSWNSNTSEARLRRQHAYHEVPPKTILDIDARSGTFSEAHAVFQVSWATDGHSIERCQVRLVEGGTEWSGGNTGSELSVTFEGRPAAAFTTATRAAIEIYFWGRCNPAGPGDMAFSGSVIVYGDGTMQNNPGRTFIADGSGFTHNELPGGGYVMRQI